MKTYSRVYAKIDLDAVAWNMEQMKKNLKEGTEMVAVIWAWSCAGCIDAGII